HDEEMPDPLPVPPVRGFLDRERILVVAALDPDVGQAEVFDLFEEGHGSYSASIPSASTIVARLVEIAQPWLMAAYSWAYTAPNSPGRPLPGRACRSPTLSTLPARPRWTSPGTPSGRWHSTNRSGALRGSSGPERVAYSGRPWPRGTFARPRPPARRPFRPAPRRAGGCGCS